MSNRLSQKSLRLLKSFNGWLARRGVKESTRYRYLEVVGDFLAWSEAKGLNAYDLKVLDVEEYLSEVRGRGISLGTLHWYVVGIKSLLKYFSYLSDDPKYAKIYEKIKVPKVPQGLPDCLTPEEVRRLLSAFPNLKHKALFSLIYETGCRISEALNLKVGDVLVGEEYIKVFFRESKSEARTALVVIFTGVIKEWLNKHEASYDPEAYLFYGRNPYKRMCRSNALYRLKEAAKRAGLKRRIYIHLLRHTRATELYGVFKELEMMRWFGWKTRRMIDVYSKVNQEDLESKYLSIYGHLSQVDDVGRSSLCPRCGYLNPPNAHRCLKCGYRLSNDVLEGTQGSKSA